MIFVVVVAVAAATATTNVIVNWFGPVKLLKVLPRSVLLLQLAAYQTFGDIGLVFAGGFGKDNLSKETRDMLLYGQTQVVLCTWKNIS